MPTNTFAINRLTWPLVQEYVTQIPSLVKGYVNSKPSAFLAGLSLAGITIGFVIGLFLFGWWLTPVEYSPATYYDLTYTRQVEIVYLAADLFAYSRNAEQANGLLQSWGGGYLACQLITEEQNLDKRERLLALTRVTGATCNGE